MSTVTRETPEARGSAPNRLVLVEGLRRLRRAQVPRARGAREVVVRVRPGQQARVLRGGGARG